MALLTKDEYLGTMGTPMTPLLPDDEFRPVPLGDYVRAIPEEDFAGHDFSANNVEQVYRDPTGRWIHVLLAAKTPKARSSMSETPPEPGEEARRWLGEAHEELTIAEALAGNDLNPWTIEGCYPADLADSASADVKDLVAAARRVVAAAATQVPPE